MTTPADYPWWTTKDSIFLPVPQEKSTVQYRYCVFAGGKFLRLGGEWGDHERPTASKRQGGFGRHQHKGSVRLFGCPTMPQRLQPPRDHRACPTSRPPQSQVTKSSSSRAWQLTNWGRRAKSNNSLSASDRVLIISYFLPVTLSKDDQGQWAATWNKENLLAMRIGSNGGTDKICWVGTVRYNGAPIPVEEEMAVANLLAGMSCLSSIHHSNHASSVL